MSLWVREYLVSLGLTKANQLQRETVRFVSAVAQSKFVLHLIENHQLSDEEMSIYLRGRNHKSLSKAKNTDVLTYRQATGFEALVGYWYLTKADARLEQIWNQMKTTL